MLEADALERVVQLDIDAEVVGIELQFVSRANAAVFIDSHRERGNRPVEAELPVPIALRVALEDDFCHDEQLRSYLAGTATASRRAARLLLTDSPEVSTTASARA